MRCGCNGRINLMNDKTFKEVCKIEKKNKIKRTNLVLLEKVMSICARARISSSVYSEIEQAIVGNP